MKHTSFLLTLLLALLISMPAFADFTLTDWQFQKTFDTSEIDTAQYMHVVLDSDIASADNNFADVRIVDEDGSETPYQLVIEREGVETQERNTTILNKEETTNGETQFMIDLGANTVLHNSLEIQSSSENYRRNVSVFGADSLLAHTDTSWRLLTDEAYIYAFSDEPTNFETTRSSIVYTPSSARFLRIVIDAGVEGPVEVTQATVRESTLQREENRTYTLPFERLENSEKNYTELQIDLGAEGIPSTGVTLETEESNFNRRVQIESSANEEDWRTVVHDDFFILETPTFVGSNTSIEYRETTNRHIRLRIFNNDNAPLELLPTATVRSIVRSVVFEALPETSYTLYYGNPQTDAPRYDLERFFNYLDLGDIPELALSDAEENPDHIPPQKPLTQDKPYILNISLGILIAIIAVFLVVYVRKMVPVKTEE